LRAACVAMPQPLAQGAPAEVVPPGLPALAYRAEVVQVVGRRQGAVVRVVPAQLEASVALVFGVIGSLARV
jgi:hypothetical protein